MADLDAALVQQFLDISVAERKMVVQPDRVLDDRHRETMAVRLGIGHVGSAYPSPIKATQPLEVLLQRHRDTEAAKTFLIRLLGEYDVPEVIHTDQLRSYGAAIRELPSPINVDHQQVISTARCNNLIEQRASVASRAVLPKIILPSYTASRTMATRIQSAETRARISEPARPSHQPPPSFPL